jgi:hypothetical protein
MAEWDVQRPRATRVRVAQISSAPITEILAEYASRLALLISTDRGADMRPPGRLASRRDAGLPCEERIALRGAEE